MLKDAVVGKHAHHLFCFPVWAVLAIGNITSSTRTADQSDAANFWKGNVEAYWFDITQQVRQTRLEISRVSLYEGRADLGLMSMTIEDFAAGSILFVMVPLEFQVVAPLTITKAALYLAVVAVAQADARIAAWDSKYTYVVSRSG